MPRDRRGGLVERARELAEIDDCVGAAVAGQGVCVVFEGPAGIGKTALLAETRQCAARAGVSFLTARGAELEGDFPYGVVRQLLEVTLRDAPAARRRRLCAGVAAFASPAVLGEGSTDTDPAGQPFAVLHGLYWLVASLAAERPLVLLVDDIHWADATSLRFLAYLVRRLEGLRTSVVASIRSGEVGSDPRLVGEIARTPGVRLVHPKPLSESGVASVLEDQFGRAPAARFASACWEATAGNPFFLRELAAALIANGTEPALPATGSVAVTAPDTIAQSTVARLGRLSGDAVALARSIAVLGLDATLPRSAALARLAQPRALAALDALAAADLVSADVSLAFRHPIVRTAIYQAVPAGVCSEMHGRAARLLAAQGADLDRVAGHLLRTLPMGSPTTIATLRDAARRSLAVGAPDAAATYLDRALEEYPERTLRLVLLLELGRAEQLARSPKALARYDEARALANDPVTRAKAMLEQVAITVYMGDATQALALVDGALAELPDHDEATAVEAQTWRAVATAHNPRLITSYVERLPLLQELAESGRAGTRPLALLLASRAAQQGERAEQVRAMVERGWDDGAYLADGDSVELFPQGLRALILCDELDLADDLIDAARVTARKRGSVVLHLIGDRPSGARRHPSWRSRRRRGESPRLH